jgi:glycosyltransferase involved in cell wall biosynthesis
LVARGHHVQLLCPAEAPIYRAAQERGLDVTPLPIARRNWQALAAARTWMRRHRVDAINTHSATDSWLFALAARTLRRRPAIVRTRHISARLAPDPLTRWLYGRGADLLVTTGERLRQVFLEHYRLPPEHVVSAPTGIDTDHFSPGERRHARRQLGLPPDRLIVGIVATIRRQKGHIYLLDAVRQMPQRDDVLVLVVGDGPSRNLVEAKIAECGLTRQVLMVGQQRDVTPWLHSMDICTLPSCAEGVPQSILQAMSCGLPVVATAVGGIVEAVAHEQTGLLVPPQDPAALAQALARLASDAALRQRMGQQGRRIAVEQFTVSQMLDRMEDVFFCAVQRRVDRTAAPQPLSKAA